MSTRVRGALAARAPFVAVRSFTYVDRLGRKQSVTAGVTYVAFESEDYQSHPQCFARAAQAERSASVGAATAAHAAPPVQLRDMAQLPTTIHMTRSIRLSLEREAGRSRDGLESGGFLVGTAWERGVQVMDVYGHGPGTKRGPRMIELDGGLGEQFLSQFPPSMRIIGSWHSHPGASYRPSPLDLDAWRDFLGWYPECRAALILTPDLADGWPWAHPQIHAFMLRRHRLDRSVLVEPASVEVA